MNKTVLKCVVLMAFVVASTCMLVSSGCSRTADPKKESGKVPDEARVASRAAATFPAADEDYFREMDGGVPLTPDEVKGRNMWIVWTGGNDRFWDGISATSFGSVDLLKTVSSHPKLKFSRDNRWIYLGLVNEPCFDKPTGPDSARFGLWLDKRSATCPPDPFENEAKYPGVKIGARGKNMPVGSYYGWASGIAGLRLFPNPDFDEAAAKKWDAEKYYSDPKYYNSKDLVKPYRVGMSCAFCHIGPDPVRPPADPEHPEWKNLASNVGAQYFWIDRILDWDADPATYIFQMFHTSRPGTLDTSLVSTDNINNPRTMNAVYGLRPRLEQAKRFGKETLAAGGGSGLNKQFNDYPRTASLSSLFVPPTTVYSPRVLKDGADSVGGLGALNRVYLNIGLFSEEWLLHFNPLVGGRPVTPIQIADARRNSSYWEATEAQTPDMALFFLKTTEPHKLKDAPGGTQFLNNGKPDDAAYQKTVERGKVVFAENCARCHSSKLPAPAEGLDLGGCSGKDYMNCWNKYWAWTKTDDFKSKMRAIVAAPDFLDNNYLSAEHRVPVTLLQTNACSPLATNGLRGNIWDNFTSETYKDLPSVGTITVYNPQTGEPKQFPMPAGGRGYTRPASLISLWSTAPFLLNNSVGKFNPSPSVEARMQSFQDSIEKMLWPDKREKDATLVKAFAERNIKDFPGVIDRTSQRSFLRVAPGYVPDQFKGLVGIGRALFPSIFGDGGIMVGPIPPGTPVNLLANLNLLADDSDLAGRIDHDGKVLRLALKVKHDLEALGDNPTDEQAGTVFMNLVAPMMELSKCPDYIVNRGHYFGTGYLTDEPALSDQDKRALIEFLKTF
jgi:hypothetical protein